MQRRGWSREAEASVPVGGLLMAVGPSMAHDAPPEVDSNYAPARKARQYSKFSRIAGRFDAKGGDQERSRFAASSPPPPVSSAPSSDAGFHCSYI